ncbi:sulfotransferase family protein [Erythrobacter sp.]|jgi:hypothetical protein|uniref:sulfotransferase family protein n=1 Tax=Erythrobacter sp. TaxID=1042 RepID=UPI002EC514B5|nr:sulfotransferase [Erythrobacter sp.]
MNAFPVRARHRYIFIAGLHRTGTSLIARVIGSHRDVAAIEGAPVPENEGCYLQGAIPHTAKDGIPGAYALDPAQHRTETDPLNTLATKERLEAEWGVWFDPAKSWRVEKSPVNLTRMRLLQALFPLAQFIVVTRHPLFMAQALQKWSDDSAVNLARYGARAYRLMLDDLDYLHAAMVVRYEDFVARPDAHTRAFEAFLGVDQGMEAGEVRDGNTDYKIGTSPQGEVPRLGYDGDGTAQPIDTVVRHPLRAVREATLAALRANRPTNGTVHRSSSAKNNNETTFVSLSGGEGM